MCECRSSLVARARSIEPFTGLPAQFRKLVHTVAVQGGTEIAEGWPGGNNALNWRIGCCWWLPTCGRICHRHRHPPGHRRGHTPARGNRNDCAVLRKGLIIYDLCRHGDYGEIAEIADEADRKPASGLHADGSNWA
jgi:hypothetical protein